MSTAYLRLELLRMFRNRRFFVFSLGFPIVLYYLIAGPNKNNDDLGGSGIPAPVYYMVGLVAFGTMTAVLSAGARISAERSTGWNRQLRITPLTTRDYFRTKVLTGYAAAGATIAVMYIAGATLGVRLPARNWIEMTGLILVGLVPFAAAARGSRSRATGCSRRSPSSCRRTGLCRRVMSAWVAPRGGARGGSSSAPGRSG